MSGDAFTELVLEVFRLNGEILASGDRLTEPHGQTSARWQVMGALTQPATVSEAASKMGLTRQSVQRIADRLVAEGICESRPNPRHKRAPLIALSKKGEKILEKISREQATWAAHLSKSFSEEELVRVNRLLRRVREALAEENEGGENLGAR